MFRRLNDYYKKYEVYKAMCDEVDGPKQYKEAITDDSNAISLMLGSNTFNDLAKRVRLMSFTALGRKKVADVSEEKKAASSELVGKVQTVIDPEQNHGEGDGMAPMCHNVLLKSVITQSIEVKATIEFDTGYSAETSETQIIEAVEKYFSSLRDAWESNELNDTIVRTARIEAAILNVEGVKDISVQLDGKDENISLTYEYIPMLGGVTIE